MAQRVKKQTAKSKSTQTAVAASSNDNLLWMMGFVLLIVGVISFFSVLSHFFHWASDLSALRKADKLRLIAELYNIYKKHHKEEFDEFYHWGEVLIADFDMIDKYMVDAQQLFRNVSDLKELEADMSYLTKEQIALINRFWRTIAGGKEDAVVTSAAKSHFLAVWRSLGAIYEEFRHAVDKALAWFAPRKPQTPKSAPQKVSKSLIVKADYKQHVIPLSDILYIKGEKDYVRIRTVGGEIKSLMSMRSVEQSLPAELFQRIHRSYIVNLDRVTTVGNMHATVGEESIPVSNSYKEEFMQRLTSRGV